MPKRQFQWKPVSLFSQKVIRNQGFSTFFPSECSASSTAASLLQSHRIAPPSMITVIQDQIRRIDEEILETAALNVKRKENTEALKLNCGYWHKA